MTNTVLHDKPLYPGTCEWCGAPCNDEDTACGVTCEAKLLRHERLQGRDALRLLKLWRRYRGRKGTPGEGMLSAVASAVDIILREDRMRRSSLSNREHVAQDD